MAILPPWPCWRSCRGRPSALPDISRPTSKPSFMPSSFCTSASDLLRDVRRRSVAPILRGQLEPVRVDVGDRRRSARRRGATTAAAMMPIGPGAGDQHVLAEHVERQRGVHGVAERIEDRRDVAGRCRRRDARRWSSAARCTRRTRPARLTPTPAVSAHRCRRPARQLRQRPQTTWPSPLTISPAWKSLTFEPTSTISPTNSWPIDHRHGDRLLRPGVPVVDVHVGAADAGAQHPDQHVVDADLRLRHVLQPQPGLGPALHQRPHRGDHGTQRSGMPPVSPSGRGPWMRRSDGSMATSLMLASRRRISPCSSNSQFSLPYDRHQRPSRRAIRTGTGRRSGRRRTSTGSSRSA